MEKCKGCGKENFSTEMYSIAKKWKEGEQFYGTCIYSCDDCYYIELEKFKSNMGLDDILIIREPLLDLPIG